MADPFATLIMKMRDMGMFNYLFPFMLGTAMIYGMLRKSRMFGDPEQVMSINAVVAIVSSFMLMAYPVLIGESVEPIFANFFMQGLAAALVMSLILGIVGMFFPADLPKFLGERFNQSGQVMTFIIVAALIGGTIFITSGMINLILPQGMKLDFSEVGGAAGETAIVLIFLALPVYLVFTGGNKSQPSK